MRAGTPLATAVVAATCDEPLGGRVRHQIAQLCGVSLPWVLVCLAVAAPARAQLATQESLCDPVYQDCRADLLTYIQQEKVGIDAGFWLMDDDRYAQALIARWQAGVPVRLLVDPRCVEEHSACQTQLNELKAAGIPMRYRTTSGILHWKTMIFASQQQLEFSGANYAPFEMVPDTPWVNYTEELVYYTNDPSLVHSFMTEFDNLWTSTTEFANYANATGALKRNYPTYAIDPDLNFPPDQSYRDRSTAAYAAETQGIDVQMFRITDAAQSSAIVKAVNRGIPVRLITDTSEYRDPTRLWDAYNVDLMYTAGVQVRMSAHQGIDHEKAIICRAQGLSIFGSSNWTSPSSDTQREHNYFTTKGWIFSWLTSQFDRKWNNSTGNEETKAFVPLPPDTPSNASPSNGAASAAATGVALSWNAGPWGQLYDVYFGVSSNPPLLAENQQLGPSQSSTDMKTFALPPLQPGTTYYWKIVSKTMAYVTAAGNVWSFTTAGTRTVPVRTDIDHDGRSDLLVWRPSTGFWYWAESSTGYSTGGSAQWGSSAQGDVPLSGDIDGDGIADFVVWRGNGTFYWITSSTGYSVSASGQKQWGDPSQHDVPMLADIDGDGRADLVVWRPGNGTWYWLLSSKAYATSASGQHQWGNGSLGDVPLLGDLDGDGKADLVVWRASTGVWYWLTSSSGYAVAGSQRWGSGSLGDVPLLGDLDGDGRAELVVWRASTGTWFWLRSMSGYSYSSQGEKQWGNEKFGDVPLLGDVDGDGAADLIVWRPSTGTWYWLTSSSDFDYGSQGERQWGTSGDVPIMK